MQRKRLFGVPLLIGLLLIAAGALLLAGGQQAQAAISVIELNLTGAQETPPVTSPGSAFARITVDDVTKVLTYDLTVSGLSPNLVTAAHIHRGAAGVAGPVIYPLSTTGFTQVSGKIQLTDADMADLRAGNLYVNVHSVEFPGGFARAQIILPEQQVTNTLQALIGAFNRQDVNGFLGFWSDAALQEEFGESRADLVKDLPGFFSPTPISLRNVRVSVSGSSATAALELVFPPLVEGRVFGLTLERGAWTITSSTQTPAAIPSGVPVVPLQLREFSFVYDKSALASGNFAFQVSNVGRQEHEIDLVRLEGNVNLAQELQKAAANPQAMEGPPPPGIEDIGAAGPYAPGAQSTLVFTQPLAPGRYALLCFLPDTDGIPHAFKGMFSEFTVGGGGITPPSTGDAGLAGGRSGLAGLLAVSGLGLLLLGLGGATLARKQ